MRANNTKLNLSYKTIITFGVVGIGSFAFLFVFVPKAQAINFNKCPTYTYGSFLITGSGSSSSGGTTGGTAGVSGPTTACGAIAVAEAQKQIGKPYVYGASGPNSFDCSGLVVYAYKKAGVSLTHSSRGQYSGLPRISGGSEQAGDLVFFGSPVHHVGIVIGGDKMIEAPNTGGHVQIKTYSSRHDITGFARPKCP